MEKLNRIKVEEMLKEKRIYLFTPRDFTGIFNVPEKTAHAFISRNVASGLFIKLRNGYYTVKDSHCPLYFIANKLYQPSYISLETALSHYGIIPEVVYTLTSVTTKTTREFDTPVGVFSYQTIKQEVFRGYHPMSLEGNTVLFAEPEKALADYLYFVDLKKMTLNDRIRLSKIRKKKLVEYAKIFNRPGIIKLIHFLYAESRRPSTIH